MIINMGTEILRIIEGGLNRDIRKVVSYSNRLADRLDAEGDKSMAECIREKLDLTKARTSAVADAMRVVPLDADSHLQIVEIIPSDESRQKIILSPFVKKQVEEFVTLVTRASELELAGVEIPKSMLLYGAPGCGKTSIAHYISEKTNLPLIVARLDGIVSSLLGSTAKNLRKIFEYASSMPCILFLDEFDAIAKARDDAHELGELKRVINSLLQNIDSLPLNCVLLAATNHSELLDKAVWRRFTQKIKVGIPTRTELKEMIPIFANPFGADILKDSSKVNALIESLKGLSPSDIRTIFDRAKAKAVLEKSKTISFEKLLENVYELTLESDDEAELVIFLRKHGATLAEINQGTGISLRKVKEYTAKLK